MLLAPAVIGMAFCCLASLSLSLTNLTAGQILTLVLVAAPIPYVSIALHEVGHYVCGRAVGFRLSVFAVWPVVLVREARGFRLRCMRAVLPQAVPGQVMMTRPTVSVWRLAVMILGGPLANLLLAAGCATLGLVTIPARSGGSAWRLPLLCGVGATVNLFWLTSLVPARSRGMDSDGLQLLRLFGAHRRQRLWAALNTALVGGTRPRDWETRLVAQLRRACDGLTADISVVWLSYYHALDTARLGEANDLIDRALTLRDTVPDANGALRSAIVLEAAYMAARYRHDADRAREHLALDGGEPIDGATRERATAAVLLEEKQLDEAERMVKLGFAALSLATDRGGAAAETDLLNELLAEWRRKSSSGPPCDDGQPESA
jgi:hypothetical protein